MEQVRNLCGPLNENLKVIEDFYRVHIANDGNHFSVTGRTAERRTVIDILQSLYNSATEELSVGKIHEIFNAFRGADTPSQTQLTQQQGDSLVCLALRQKRIAACGFAQARYLQMMEKKDVVFGIGPAGTGKTFLAVAKAVQALEQKRAEKIILVRPVVEAGEKLGFLPGDLSQKVDPYLRPIYDSLYSLIGSHKTDSLIDAGIIELVPLAFMRGRSLNNVFILLDEAQNTTTAQMKMFLTRLGVNSKSVVTGDLTQIDLPKAVSSGLQQAVNILSTIKKIGFCFFERTDIHRHPLVKEILDAYETASSKID